MQKTLHSLDSCIENFPLIQISSILSVNFTSLWHKCQRVFWCASCTSARHAGSFDCLMTSLILITMDNGRGHCAAYWQSCKVPNQTHRGIIKKWNMYAIKQIKICAEYQDMLPRPRLDLSGTPGLRPIGFSPGSWQTSLGLGSMSRYSAQILICITKVLCRSLIFKVFVTHTTFNSLRVEETWNCICICIICHFSTRMWHWELKSPHALRWRHNGSDGVSNHQPNCLFRRRSKKTWKLCVTGLCVGNSPVTGEFPAQRASNAENSSIWWRHHGRQWHVYPTWSVSWLLVAWRRKEPGLQPPCYRPGSSRIQCDAVIARSIFFKILLKNTP